MKTTKTTEGNELAAIEAKLKAEKQQQIAYLNDRRREAVEQQNHHSQIMAMWRGEQLKAERQLAILEAEEVPVEEKISKSRLVYQKLAEEPGRRWSAAELEAVAGGKVRLAVAEWNARHSDRMIQTEGANKNRRYFVQ